MDDLVNEFLVESHENLERLDRALLTLERDPGATELIADIFRTIHTIKGTCGFLGLSTLERLSHSGESLLARVRDGEKRFDAEISQALFELVDAVRKILASIASSGGEGDESFDGVIRELEALCADKPGRVSASADPVELPAGAAPPGETATAESAASIRVDVEHLDRLMNLVGELVLARNQIQLHAEHSGHAGLRAGAQRLALLTGELQDGVMRTRMQPIGKLWAKVPRLVRDLCAQLDKRVRVELVGAQTAIDRSILEALRDPLTHMVRNSIDHGIESPTLRRQTGKPEEGRLLLRAWTEGGQVRLNIEDDGAGIDPERLRRRALERGIIGAEEAQRMGESDSLALIFRPGFSTALAVSNLSGRGVGMDVVKTNLERLGGSVSVVSRVGSGTCIELRIPLTLAIVPALMIECAAARFALPAGSVVEIARIPKTGPERAIEFVQGAPVLRLRDGLLPLVDLRALLEFPRACAEDPEQHVIVLESEGRQFGLTVDLPRDIEEIVVKPLGPLLEGLGLYSGATIQGDGSVALILDVPTLARRGGIGRSTAPQQARDSAAASAQATTQVLVFDVRNFGRVALELGSVLRLEEFPRERVERSAGSDVVQWRGEVVPLVSLEDCLGAALHDQAGPALDGEGLTLAVCDVAGRRVGLVVHRIVDVAELTLPLSEVAGRPWIRGQTLLLGRVTDLLDLGGLAGHALDRAAQTVSVD